MSKSMAIDGVMKIFLMVAVIIVGMSFLMKAFGIDLIGWLQGMLGGIGIPGEGKILYIKMDPDDNQVFAFFVTSEKNKFQEIEKGNILKVLHTYFLPDSLDSRLCVIYTVKERDNTLADAVPDKGYYYYVNPGALIQQSCNSLGQCIQNFVLTNNKGCNKKNIDCPFISKDEIELNECSKKLAGKFVVGDCGCDGRATCDDTGPILGSGTDRKVESETFQSSYNFVDFCDEKKPTSKCNLLVLGEYNIKYGLLCDSNGVWRVCKDSAKSDFQGGDCDFNGEVGVWTSKIPQPTPTNPPSNVLLRSIPTTGTTVNLQFSLIISAEDKDSDLSVLHLNLDDQGDKKGKCESAETRSDLEDSGRTLRFTCSGNSCQTSWKIKCSVADTYKFQGQAVDSTGLSTTTNTASMLVQK